MKRFRRVVVAAVAMSGVLSVAPSGSSAQTLPGQASPVADEHTHGPDGLELDRRGRPGVAAASYDVDKHAQWSSTGYDGAVNLADVGDGVRTGTAMFHAIYVYPSDKPSRFGTYAAMFQADARDASMLLETLYGRAIRFDERGSMLDITVVRSRYNARQLAGTRQFNLVYDELIASGRFNAPNKKYVVWLDSASKYCGQGHLSQDIQRNGGNANNFGGSLAIVYRPYDANDPTTGGFCRGRTLLHELGHTMGALQKVAPHAYDGAHCNDSAEDTMCYVSATSVDTGGPAFDHNNDDYWDPAGAKLAWWTVNLSAFLCDAPDSCDVAASKPQAQY